MKSSTVSGSVALGLAGTMPLAFVLQTFVFSSTTIPCSRMALQGLSAFILVEVILSFLSLCLFVFVCDLVLSAFMFLCVCVCVHV